MILSQRDPIQTVPFLSDEIPRIRVQDTSAVMWLCGGSTAIVSRGKAKVTRCNIGASLIFRQQHNLASCNALYQDGTAHSSKISVVSIESTSKIKLSFRFWSDSAKVTKQRSQHCTGYQETQGFLSKMIYVEIVVICIKVV